MNDVLIIGGGVCGCSLLYELSKYSVDVLLVEKENDVGVSATKANSGIVHAGYDPESGTKMATYNVEGNYIIEQLAGELDIMYKKIGSLVIGFNDDDRGTIVKLYNNGVRNGVTGLRIVEYDELHQMESALSKDVKFALYAPSAGIVSPWELAFAQAEIAIVNGMKVFLDTEVIDIRKEIGYFLVKTQNGDEIESRFVVNAAGINSDKISQLVEPKHFTIQAKRGQYFLMDTVQKNLVKRAIFPCPGPKGKGVLISPTVHGNLIVGPDAEDVQFADTSTTKEALEFIRKCALTYVPSLNFKHTIRNFAGLRADANRKDFIVGESEHVPGFFNIANIKSPGLTSAPAIARDVVDMLHKAGLKLNPNKNFKSKREIDRFKHMSEEERAKIINKDPLYARVVCRCNTVTEGEILDALRRPLSPRSLDAVKRRCTTGMGRCQGGFCSPLVHSIVAKELKMKQTEVPLDRCGMNIVVGETRGGGEAL